MQCVERGWCSLGQVSIVAYYLCLTAGTLPVRLWQKPGWLKPAADHAFVVVKVGTEIFQQTAFLRNNLHNSYSVSYTHLTLPTTPYV